MSGGPDVPRRALHVPESLPPDGRYGGGLATTLRRIGTLLADRPFLGYAFAFALGFGTLFSYLAASPFVYENVFGVSIGTYAVILAANAIGFTATSALNRRIVPRLGARLLLRVGLVVMALCSATLCLLAGTGLLVRDVAVPLVFVTVSSLGLIAANATALAVARAPQAAGSASAIVGLCSSVWPRPSPRWSHWAERTPPSPWPWPWPPRRSWRARPCWCWREPTGTATNSADRRSLHWSCRPPWNSPPCGGPYALGQGKRAALGRRPGQHGGVSDLLWDDVNCFFDPSTSPLF